MLWFFPLFRIDVLIDAHSAPAEPEGKSLSRQGMGANASRRQMLQEGKRLKKASEYRKHLNTPKWGTRDHGR